MTTNARRPRTALAALLALLTLGAGLLGSSPPAAADPPPPTADGRPPRDIRQIEVLNVSHRAEVRGTTKPPENTLAAIEEAIRVGADAVELDVTLTADDELVLMHDRSLNRTTDAVEVFGPGTHHTASYTLAQLKTLSAGTFDGEVQRIPTFGEALDLIRGRIALLIDVKYDHSTTAIEPLIAAELEAQPGFEEWGPDTVSFGSYGWTSLQAARQLLPDLELTFIMNYLCVAPNGVIAAGDLPPARAEGIPGITPGVTTIDQFTQKLVDGGIDTVGIFALSQYQGTQQSCAANDFTTADVDRFTTAGIRFSQNAETAEAMNALIGRGVRAILTDHPDVLATVLPTPDAPTDVAAVAGDGSATVSWTPPDPYVGSRRTGYVVEVDPGGAIVRVPADATSAEVSGLENGTAYTFRVTAENHAGGGLSSAASDPVTPVAAPTADELYVRWLYGVLLGRDADAAGLAHWTGVLDAGGSRTSVVAALRRSAEGTRHRDVVRPYVEILDRTPGAGEREYWYGELRRGLPLWKVEANVLASAELRTLVGSDEAWVRKLFGVALGRSASDADVAWFTGRLAAGGSRGTIAGQVLNSAEGARRTVLDAHVEILDRSGLDDPAFPAQVARQRATRDVRPLEIALAASDAAYARVTER
ncbi:MAG TPA: glycerophosphodiester phosphodiesterase family protein [Iamia sp.]|nr:glycerophosphodiester phosphodiesterase family protein [Iamia sp.]